MNSKPNNYMYKKTNIPITKKTYGTALSQKIVTMLTYPKFHLRTQNNGINNKKTRTTTEVAPLNGQYDSKIHLLPKSTGTCNKHEAVVPSRKIVYWDVKQKRNAS